jgi:hypothetical protein
MRSEWVARTLCASFLLSVGLGCNDGERELAVPSGSQGGAHAVHTTSGTGGSGTSGEAGAPPITSSTGGVAAAVAKRPRLWRRGGLDGWGPVQLQRRRPS